MMADVRSTQKASTWTAGPRRICCVAALCCLLAICLTVRPVLADELNEFLDKADQSMRDSADSLRSKNADQSVSHQSSAIRNLEQYLTSDQDRSSGDLQQDQQNLRDRLNKLMDELAKRGMRQKGQKGQPGQQGQPGDDADQQQPGDDGDSFGDADTAMGDADGKLGDGNADAAAESQGKAVDALKKSQQQMADQMQQGDGDGQGDGPSNRMGRQQSSGSSTDPLGRPLHGREYGDDLTVKIPGEVDVQRARRILEELRRRLADPNRPQVELDYLERLLKDY